MEQDRERLILALRAADAAGNTKDATVLANALKSMDFPKGKPKRSPSGRLITDQPSEEKMGFLNKSLAEVLGAPVDITNALLSTIGLDSERPFGGSESIRAGMKKIGAPTPDREPETLGEKVFSGMGEAAGFMLPVAAVARRYQAAKGIGGQLASGFNREMVEKPIRTAALELTSGAGVGVGREFAEQKDLGPSGRALAELAGGMSPSALALSPTLSLARAGKKAVQGIGAKAFIPFTTAGAEARAARRLQGLVDEGLAAQQIDEFPELSPAAATGQEGALDLEDAVLRGDPARSRRISQRSAEEIDRLQASILSEGESLKGAPKKLMDLRKTRAKAALEARVERAADEAAEALNQLGSVSPEDASVIVRERLQSALNDAKIEEARLWNRVPRDAKAPVSETRKTFFTERKSLSKAQSDDMPVVARRVLGGEEGETKKEFLLVLDARGNQIPVAQKVDNNTTIKELDGLYKKLGEEATQARANKEFNKARIAENLREAILRDIDNAQGSPEVLETIQTARAYSNTLNDKFRSGPVGKILGYGREGGMQIDPSLSMEKTIGVSGQTGELARRAVAKATMDDPTALEGMQNYIKGRFLRNVVEDGRVDSSRAKTFIRNNKELLDAFPELKRQLTAAKTTEDVLRRVTKQGDGFRRAIDKPEVGSASKILNSTVGDEMDRVFSRTNVDPVASIKAVKRTLAKDKTGDAAKGFKAGASEWLFQQAKGQGEVANGAKLLSLLKSESKSKVFREIYTPDEYNRLVRIAELMRRFQVQQTGRRAPIAVLQDKPAWLLDVMSGVLGAKVGSRIARFGGSGNIQTPGIFSRTFRNMTKKLTADKAAQMLSDAIEDPKLFKALLEYRPLQKGRGAIQRNKRYEKTFDAWMAGPGARLFEDDEEEGILVESP